MALKGTALIRAPLLTVARLRTSTTGRRRSALLTGGGLIGVRRHRLHRSFSPQSLFGRDPLNRTLGEPPDIVAGIRQRPLESRQGVARARTNSRQRDAGAVAQPLAGILEQPDEVRYRNDGVGSDVFERLGRQSFDAFVAV